VYIDETQMKYEILRRCMQRVKNWTFSCQGYGHRIVPFYPFILFFILNIRDTILKIQHINLKIQDTILKIQHN